MRRDLALPAAAAALASALCLLAASPAHGQAEMEIRGSVHHQDGRPMGGIPVVLEVHDGERILERLEATTDDSGAVTFSDVPAAESNVARLGAEYAGATYHSQPVLLRGGDLPELTVTVAEISREGRPLHLDTLHIIVQVDEPTLYQVLQFATVSNAGEAAWAAGPPLADGSPSGIVIPIPEDAAQIRPAPFPDAARALPEDAMEVGPGRVLDPRPVPPDGRQVALTYVLDAANGPVDLRLTLPYPTQSVSVLVGGGAAGAIEFADTTLTRADPQQIGEHRYEMWTGAALSPGVDVLLRLGPRTAPLSPRTWALIGLGLALALAVAGSFRGLRPGPGDEEVRERILRRIARLDIEHEAGELEGAEYHRRRGEEVERLLLVQARLEEGAGDRSGTAAASDG